MITPLDNRVIVRPFPVETMRQSGIILIQSEQEKPLSGEVVAIGPGLKKEDGTREPMQVNAGDRVMYGKYAPQTFTHKGENLLSMCEMDVLFIME